MERILDGIHSQQDIKDLTKEQITALAAEIRQFLVENVSQTGGHLASNLGVVELTIALIREFDLPTDKIIWDVGHQSYVYKMLTGRANGFTTLRQYGGLSGFPKTCESEFDAFNTGHSSTSISAAAGIAKARDLSGDDHSVIAVIGDGALTGGMAFEALNHAGQADSKIIVILNDNQMSISGNVGSLAKSLNRLRARPSYSKVKKFTERTVEHIPLIGLKVRKLITKIKNSFRDFFVPGAFFEELGFAYLGPIDGYSMNDLHDALEYAKHYEGPILLHIFTTKGKGYSFAEDNPGRFHGISKFNMNTGKSAPSKFPGVGLSAIFGNKLCELAKTDNKITAITAAMPQGTGLSDFAERFPQRFIDVGIAEQHAVTFAAGLAIQGYKPVVAVYSTFLQRAYDQIFHDVCLQNLGVVFCLDRAGLVGEDGETHHGIFDLSYLSHLPHMAILAPSSPKMLEHMLSYAVSEHIGPIAIRYPKVISDPQANGFSFGKAEIMMSGTDVTLISVGGMLGAALSAIELVPNISVELIDLRTVKPLDVDTIRASAEKTQRVIVIEDNCTHGGAGSMVESVLNKINVIKMGFPPDCIPQHGNNSELFREFGLDEDGLAQAIRQIMED